MFSMAAMTILSIATLANIPASAQDEASMPQTEDRLSQARGGSRDNYGDFEGTWDVQVTIRNCQNGAGIRTFPSLTTFFYGGEVIDSTSGLPQAAKTPGHGVWRRLGGRRYSFKTKAFTFDAGGNPTGWTIITHNAELNRVGNAFESAGGSQIYNTAGDLVATGCSTTTAVRFE